MKFLIILLSSLILVGCQTCPIQPEPVVITKTEYIVRKPPEKLLVLPEPVKDIDVDTASQAEVSSWLIDNEAYINELKDKFIGVSKFLSEESNTTP